MGTKNTRCGKDALSEGLPWRVAPMLNYPREWLPAAEPQLRPPRSLLMVSGASPDSLHLSLPLLWSLTVYAGSDLGSTKIWSRISD